MKSKEFVKMKVYEDVSAYNRAVKDAESKIKVVEVALEWCAKHIDTEKIDKKKFLSDMVSKYVKIYPIDIQRGTSAFIKFDYQRNKYVPNL